MITIFSLFNPLFVVVDEGGVGVDGDLEVCAGAAGEEVAVDFLELYSWVEVEVLLLDAGLLEDELGHELTEEFAHGVHAGLAGGHIVDWVAHGEEDRLHTAGVGGVVEFGVAVGDV